MIDITVDSGNELSIESKTYYLDNQETLIEMLKDVIEKCLYSGESISLWKAEGEMKRIIQDWNNPHVSEGRKYVKQI